MKKILLSFVMFFALLLVTNAQTLLNEGFENGIPSTWTTIDKDGDGFNWTPGSGPQVSCHGGTGCVYSESYDLDSYAALTPDNWLITPQINLTSNATLKFYVAAQDEEYSAEHYAVLISTTGNAVADFTDTLLAETYTAPSASAYRDAAPYVEKTVNLSAYTGQQVYIAFRHYNVTDQFYLNLDDVSIFAQPTTPTIEVAEDDYFFDYVVLGTEETWSTTVTAYNLTEGISVSANAPFTLSTDDVNYSSNVTIPAAGGTLYVKFAPTTATTSIDTLTLTSAGAPAVTVIVEGIGLDCSNATIPYVCSFDGNSVLCWDVVDANNDDATFTFNMEEGYAMYLYDSDNDADDYLISPVFSLTGGQFATFDYYVAGASYPETFQVLAMGADTIPLTSVMTVDNEDPQPLFLDLSAFNGNYRIAIHCTSEADSYALVIEDFAVSDLLGTIVYYSDTLNYGIVILGEEKVLPFPVTYNGVTDDITYTVSAPYTVSTDNVNFTSQVIVSQPLTGVENDTIYVKFAPTAEGLSTGTLSVSYSGDTDSFTLNGEGVDCSAGIAEFPFEYDFNTGLYPPVCWTVDNAENYSVVAIDTLGDNGLAFLAVDRLVTPEIHSTNPLLLTFDYVSYAGAQAVTSFAVGYSMNTVAENDFTWFETVVADNSAFETYSNIIPANAKYVAIKVTEMNEFTYWFWTLTNYLFVDNFRFDEITEPMMLLSADNVNFGALQLGESKVESVEVATALLTSPITVAGQAEFYVSDDGVIFGATATLPAEGGTIYIKYDPTTEGAHTANITLTSDTTTADIHVEGSAVDCSGAYTLPYFEGFETELSACWENEDADEDGYIWNRYESADYAHTGVGFVYSESYNAGALTPDNFLTSPWISIPADGATLGWYVTALDGDYPEDHYSVLIYTDEDEEGTVVFSETLSYAGWAWREVELLDYAGSDIRFAFRHHNCTDQMAVAIDDVQITAGVGVESHEVTFGVYPNPANNMININASENMQKIQILNMAGQCVYSSQVGGNNTQVNVSNMADGMYFVKIYTDNGNVSTQKIVVRK